MKASDVGLGSVVLDAAGKRWRVWSRGSKAGTFWLVPADAERPRERDAVERHARELSSTQAIWRR